MPFNALKLKMRNLFSKKPVPEKRAYTREVGGREPIDENPYELLKFQEVALGDCGFGCKIYEHRDTGERVLAHNTTYGCKK